MSDTPRCQEIFKQNAERSLLACNDAYVSLAKQLERELAEAKYELAEVRYEFRSCKEACVYWRKVVNSLEYRLAETNVKPAEAQKPQVTVAEFIKDLPDKTLVTNGEHIWEVTTNRDNQKGVYIVPEKTGCLDGGWTSFNNERCAICSIPSLRVVEKPKPKRVADYFVLFPGPIVDTLKGESNIFVKETFEIGSEPEGAVLFLGTERIKHD